MQAHTRYNAPRLLHCDIKSDGTHIDRYLFDDGRVRYIETERGTYIHPSHNEPPPFILGPWNWVVLTKRTFPHQVYAKTQTRVALRQVRSAWHPAHFDHLSLRLYENAAGTFVRSNVFMPPKPRGFHCNIVVKLAHTEDQIPAIENECNVYQMLEGLGIAPRFLGYVTEDGGKIGFIVEKIEGARHAELRDANVCETAVRRLHAQGIVHNDCHSGNVLVKNGRAFLIDFETATAGYGIVGKDWDLSSRSLIR